MKIDLQPGETKIDTWSILYQAPGGQKFNGRLIITNKRLLYDTKFDMALKGTLPEIMFIRWGSVGYLEISKTDIRHIEVKKNILKKRTVLTLMDGSKHIFHHGFRGIRKVVEAIHYR